MESVLLEVMKEESHEVDFRFTVEEEVREGAGTDPADPLPVDPALLKAAPGLLSRGEVAHTEMPCLAPAWVPRGRDGYRFADDLLTEGLEELSRGNLLPARAKLECSLAILERMSREDALVSAAGMVAVLRDGVLWLRRGCPTQASLRLSPFMK